MNTFQEAGFGGQWLKPDPRGCEYGTYEAKRLGDGCIHVTYHPSVIYGPERAYKFTMVFHTDLSFKNWARQFT